jgi:hypothetical protein
MDYIIEIFNILSDLLFTQDNTQYQAIAPALVIMGLQTAFSAGQAIKGGIDKRKAEEAQRIAIAGFQNKLRNIDFQNELEALRVPTMGAELRERGIARATTAGIESMQEAGAEAVLGGVPRVVTAADAQSAEVAAELDQMQARRDEAVLREEQAIQQQKIGIERDIANIEMMRLQGAGQAAADAARQQQAGIAGIASGLGGMAVQSSAAQNPYGTQPTNMTTPSAAEAQGMSLGIDTSLSPGVAGSNALTKAGVNYFRTPNFQLSSTTANPYAGLQFQQPNLQLQGYQNPIYNTSMAPQTMSLGVGGINQ